MNYFFDDFTEAEYRKLVRMALEKWELVPFTQCTKPGRICLWRHDVDLSPHRARRLARIESEEGALATYYVLPHSPYYNLLEREVRGLIREIAALGHPIGLHFDAVFYDPAELDGGGLIERLAHEKTLLERFLDIGVSTFSFHNSDLISARHRVEDEALSGMVNATGRHIKQSFAYCSDSNGYWRYRRLRDVLESGEDERLHVLTHADWWVPEPMSPRDRVSRCIDGRARNQHEQYDAALAQLGKTNVK